MTKVALKIRTNAWAFPLLAPRRYKGAKGGRARGASHFFAELAVEHMISNPNLRFVCIREVQRSLRYSAKTVIQDKISSLGVSGEFHILEREIRSSRGGGVMIFEGMQDQTADSLKSLEGFDRAWVEEAHSLSNRSLALLIPTIRKRDSEIWFSWNPGEPNDPVDLFFQQLAGPRFPHSSGSVTDAVQDFTLVHATYLDNGFQEENAQAVKEAERMRSIDSDAYEHVWLGRYATRSDAKVLAGRYVVEEFEVPATIRGTPTWSGPYHGADHGFALDPRALVQCWIGPHPKWGQNCLYIERESYHVQLGIDATAAQWSRDVPGFEKYVVRCESAEPGTNDYLRRHGVPRLEGVKKWGGSVEDGIAHLRHYDKIILHPRCPNAAMEARLYSYKVDKKTGDVLPEIVDKHNHLWDAVRYALAPLILAQGKKFAIG